MTDAVVREEVLENVLTIDGRVLRAARRYQRRRLLIPIVAQLLLMLPAVACAIVWPPFITPPGDIRGFATGGLAILGGIAGLGFYSSRVTWTLDRAPLAPASARVASHALALHRALHDPDLTGIAGHTEAVRLLYLLAHAARRLARDLGDNTIPGLAAADLATTAARDADTTRADLLHGVRSLLDNIASLQQAILNPAGDHKVPGPPPGADPRESFERVAAGLDRAGRNALDLVTLSLITPAPNRLPKRH
ncbi:hypothetical protein [Parafrankia elaeagni]|uniref:hypothetical protein n=1 Tax=Parafrankia elaeagni TaxID=222534 RepID=UPI000364F929|nr:hypothetical protein [Parafrankia elaeagni]